MNARALFGQPSRVRSWSATALLAVTVGVATGVLTLIGQRYLPGQWNTLVNSGAIWLLPVFFVGSRMPSLVRAAWAGAATLLATVGGYYVPSTLAGTPHSLFFVVLWAGVAIVAGPLYGIAGCAWRGDRRVLRIVGVAMLGGVLAAEGLFLILVLGYLWSGWAMVVAGVAAAMALPSEGERLVTLAACPLPIAAAGLVYAAINWIGTFHTL